MTAEIHKFLNELPEKADPEVFKTSRWVNLEEAHFLHNLVLLNDIEIVFESGTANGYSAAWMALALYESRQDRKYYVDTYDPVNRNKVWSVIPDFPDNIEYHESAFLSDGEAVDWGRFGVPWKALYFIDGAHNFSGSKKEIKAARRLIKPGDLLVMHDILGYENLQAQFQKYAEGRKSFVLNSKRGVGVIVW